MEHKGWNPLRDVFLGTSITLSITAFPGDALAANDIVKPMLQLAKHYSPHNNVEQFLVSEKLDGVRAYWDGKQLVTRGGHKIHCPQWFIANLPNEPLDGELWIGRGKFDEVSAIVRSKRPSDSAWRKVKFMVFDLPASLLPFELRHQRAFKLIDNLALPHLDLVRQTSFQSTHELDDHLQRIIANGGEGLMLHRKLSLYQASRTDDLQKLKPFDDAEAKVLAHLPGKGKYKGKLGAVLVETRDGTQFKIGSGFSLEERADPPAVGSTITYRYRGLTSRGLPRFASFLRVYQAL